MKAASTPQTSVKFLPHYTAQHKLLSLWFTKINLQ
jgi:hypothetical protein